MARPSARRRIAFTFLIGLAGLAITAACGGGTTVGCSDTPLPNSSVWQAATAAIDQSIVLAERDQGEEATSYYFAEAHDQLHLISAGLCKVDSDRAQALAAAIEDFHFEFDADDPQSLERLFKGIRDRLQAAASIYGSD